MTNELNIELLNRIKDIFTKDISGDRIQFDDMLLDEVCRRYADGVKNEAVKLLEKKLDEQGSINEDLKAELKNEIECNEQLHFEEQIDELNKWVGDLQKQKEKLSEINVKLEAEITRLKEWQEKAIDRVIDLEHENTRLREKVIQLTN